MAGKQKSKGALKKRFRKTGTGKVVMAKAGNNHLLLQKSKRQKRKARVLKSLSKGDRQRINM